MALTKHLKLARGIKSLFAELDIHLQQTAAMLNALQLHIYETCIVRERPLMTQQVLASMASTHRYGLGRFAQNKELRIAAQFAPLICMVISPPRKLWLQRARRFDKLPHIVHWYVPWKAHITLPADNPRNGG